MSQFFLRSFHSGLLSIYFCCFTLFNSSNLVEDYLGHFVGCRRFVAQKTYIGSDNPIASIKNYCAHGISP